MTEHTDPLDLANYCAKMSCPKWNRSLLEPKTRLSKAFKSAVIDKIYKLSRYYYRMKCWSMAQAAWESGERNFWRNYFRDRDDGVVSTYPWPYCDSKFADWEKEKDALVFDPSGCVIKDCTSYCAWKIYEKTGFWPNRKLDLHLTARNWQFFLERAGYKELVERPTYGHHYIAIDPYEGGTGMVYWVEGLNRRGNIVASTYRDQRFLSGVVITEDRIPFYIWVKIT